jgi:hypothetical protein
MSFRRSFPLATALLLSLTGLADWHYVGGDDSSGDQTGSSMLPAGRRST